MNFSDLLAKHSINPKYVVVLRHRPTEVKLRHQLRRIALEDEATFIAYQSSHRINTERALQTAKFIASFLADGPGQAIFVGLYEIINMEVVPHDRWLENPVIRSLADEGSDIGESRTQVGWFHQKRVNFYDEWKGRLVIDWPPPERSWYRRAHRNTFAIKTIHSDDELVKRLDAWDRLVFTWLDLNSLPKRFQDELAGWSGIYFIKDTSDGMGYVGAAYGAENILGRWKNYRQTGHGDNVLLRKRDPNNFQFSILERLPDNVDDQKVFDRETSWKLRLGTRQPLGLNAN